MLFCKNAYLFCAVFVLLQVFGSCRITKVKSKRVTPKVITSNEGTQVQTVNQLTDIALRQMKPLINRFHMNPFPAGDQTTNIPPLKLQLSNIKVYNITTIYRIGDVIVFDSTEDDRMTIRLDLGFNDLEVVADYRLSALMIADKGHVTAKLPSVSIKLFLIVDYETVSLHLEDLKIQGNKNMNVKFSGNLSSRFINLATDPVTAIFGGIIYDIVQGPVKDNINKLLDNINAAINQMMTSMGNHN